MTEQPLPGTTQPARSLILMDGNRPAVKNHTFDGLSLAWQWRNHTQNRHPVSNLHAVCKTQLLHLNDSGDLKSMDV